MQSRYALAENGRSESLPLHHPFTSGNVIPLAIGSTNQSLVEALKQSKIYQEYSQAFTSMTGQTFVLVPANDRSMGEDFSEDQPTSARNSLLAGLTTVAVNVENRTVGYLQTGLMVSHPPTADGFDQFLKSQALSSANAGQESLRNAFLRATVLPLKTQESAHKLLVILAQHLGMLGTQAGGPKAAVEPSVINRARAYIQAHYTEKIYLGQVAEVVNLNTFYFCKVFKRITGMNFTDYVSQLRIEKSKGLLTGEGSMSITDIAFASGFQSLTHFNRVFKKLTGLSPSAFRANTVGKCV